MFCDGIALIIRWNKNFPKLTKTWDMKCNIAKIKFTLWQNKVWPDWPLLSNNTFTYINATNSWNTPFTKINQEIFGIDNFKTCNNTHTNN